MKKKEGHRLSKINLDRIQHLIDTGRLNTGEGKVITIRELHRAGINGIKDGVHIMGRVSYDLLID